MGHLLDPDIAKAERSACLAETFGLEANFLWRIQLTYSV